MCIMCSARMAAVAALIWRPMWGRWRGGRGWGRANGSRGGGVVEEREREQRAACDVLGVKDIIFLGYPDGQLQPSLELRRELVRLMRRYRPTRIICQSPDRSWTPALS